MNQPPHMPSPDQSAQDYLAERFTKDTWQQGGPIDAYAVDSRGRWIGDFSRSPRPQDVQVANAARAMVCKETLTGIPTRLLELLEPGDMLIALRHLGGALKATIADPHVPVGGTADLEPAHADAVRRVLKVLASMPAPLAVLQPAVLEQSQAA